MPASHSPTQDPAYPWVAFRNSTCNGTYWAVRRWRPAATTDRLGWEVMMTRDLRPRRFGSEAAAARAAHAANANGGVPPEAPLTAAQRDYLISYGLDYLHSNRAMRRADLAQFVAALVGAEFDDPSVMREDLAKAKALRARGFFRHFGVKSRPARDYVRLVVAFSEAGAAAAFEALLAAGHITPAHQPGQRPRTSPHGLPGAPAAPPPPEDSPG